MEQIMAERAQQASFDWNPDPSAAAEPSRVHASPPPATPVEAPPRSRPATKRVRFDTAERRLRWLTADEATLYLGLPTRKALYAAVERGQVPAHRFGRRLRFKPDELDSVFGRAR
jgi:excisionase family DNA binding protein